MLKTGTETGSLVNHLHSRGVIGQPVPTVGMGATLLGWTDRYPGTITKVDTIQSANGKRVTVYLYVQNDLYAVVKGTSFDGSAEYEYTPNPKGSISVFRSVDGGLWEEVCINAETKRWKKTGGKGLRIGERERYYDPSF